MFDTLEGGLNPYAGSNSVMNVDPSGVMSQISLEEMGNTILGSNLISKAYLDAQIDQANRNFENQLANGMRFNALDDFSQSTTQYRPYSSYSSPIAAGIASIKHMNAVSIRENKKYGDLIYKKTQLRNICLMPL